MEEIDVQNLPKHIAIIMDGNRRWARALGKEPSEGHKAGADNLTKMAKYCNDIGVKYLTVYAFSTENWKRSQQEVSYLMFLLKSYLRKFSNSANKENIQIRVLGNIDKLEDSLKKRILAAIESTKNNTGLILNIAFNYGGRDEITNAVKKIATKVKNGEMSIDEIDENMVGKHLYTQNEPDPDLLIRPGGELRVSNYLLWQLAYTEFYFADKYWPEFDEEELMKAIKSFNDRNRKFGGK